MPVVPRRCVPTAGRARAPREAVRNAPHQTQHRHVVQRRQAVVTAEIRRSRVEAPESRLVQAEGRPRRRHRSSRRVSRPGRQVVRPSPACGSTRWRDTRRAGILRSAPNHQAQGLPEAVPASTACIRPVGDAVRMRRRTFIIFRIRLVPTCGNTCESRSRNCMNDRFRLF